MRECSLTKEKKLDRKLPVGIQGFEKIRTDNFFYVDKTEYVYRLVHNNVPYFLSRPRRFGKSLLLSTFKAYWEGKKELFEGLKIVDLEKNNKDAWKTYPVFYFDFNGDNYRNTPIETVLDGMLSDWEMIYGNQYKDRTLGDRFQKLLEIASQKSGLRSVVLIDEYDKPLLDTIDDSEIHSHIKEVFKGFFSRLKKADESIQFIFITGVSKFHKVSIFSDLNQLTDISLDRDYSGLCGITEDELKINFEQEINDLSRQQNISKDECLRELKSRYDGYRFHQDGEGVYNPYSILKAFFSKEFGSYWFETGTPSFLINKIKENQFDLRKFTNNTIYASDAILKDYTGDTLDLVPLLYQTGYLTIVDYDRRRDRYTLRFPNDEVKYGFLESLLPSFVSKATSGNGLDIFTLDEYIENGRLDDIKNVLSALFANITYTIHNDPFEHYFQAVIYLVFTLLGKFAICEMHTYTGRIDCKVETGKFVYLFEFKRDESAKDALKQIDTNDYALPFVADSREIIKIGVSFDSGKRKLVGWEVRKNG